MNQQYLLPSKFQTDTLLYGHMLSAKAATHVSMFLNEQTPSGKAAERQDNLTLNTFMT